MLLYCECSERIEIDMQLFFTIIQVIVAILLTAVVILQSGKRSGLSGAIAGGADTFMTKTKAKTWDARLAKMTKWIAIVFVILTLILNLI